MLLCCIGALVLSYVFPVFYTAAVCGVVLCLLLFVTDLLVLFINRENIQARRLLPGKFSNGDENEVRLIVRNRYRFRITCRIIDEIPFQFQERGLGWTFRLTAGESRETGYRLKPVERGEYEFGRIRVFASSRLGWAERRFSFGEKTTVAVYPSFLSLRKYELLIFGRQQQEGARRVRVTDVSTSFDQIKPYVLGDDPRTVNWKATAKCNRLMVNSYLEERSQPVYCLIDQGRTMRAPFDGMTLLDYAINASLALTDIILKKGDYAGLLTFSHRPATFVRADNRTTQLSRINEALYNQHTEYLETDFEQLFRTVGYHIPSRSLLLLFTNFDNRSGMLRQLGALKRLAEKHLLLVIVFEDSEACRVLQRSPSSLKDIYFHTLVADFTMEKKRLVKELKNNGIHTLLCHPETLTVSAINAYLELKERHAF